MKIELPEGAELGVKLYWTSASGAEGTVSLDGINKLPEPLTKERLEEHLNSAMESIRGITGSVRLMSNAEVTDYKQRDADDELEDR